MKYISKLLSGCLALSMSMTTAPKISGASVLLRGDMNFDSAINITDCILLTSVITGDTEQTPETVLAADINEDDTVNAEDLVLFITYFLEDNSGIIHEYTAAEPEPPEQTVFPLIQSSVWDANASTQSTGTAESLNIFIEFDNAFFSSDKLSEEELNEELFGNGKTKFPFESVSAFLSRSSYGNFNVEGNCVYTHVSGKLEDYSYTAEAREQLVMTVLNQLNSSINYADYDNDNDGDIDILTVTVPLDNASNELKSFWYGATHTWYYNPQYKADGVRIRKYIGNDVMPYWKNMYYFKQTYTHELGHCMGLSDYYKYASEDYEGLKGSAGFCRMDDSIGDYSSFSKLMLGWLREDEVSVYNTQQGGIQDFELKDSSLNGSALILPLKNRDFSYTSEYFLIEYVSGEGNNADVKNYTGFWYNEKKFTGYRILHVEAEMITDYWKRKDFKYDNYSGKYNGDDKQRILRLVNSESKGFFKAGDTCESLMAYDSNGYETVNSGYKVEFITEGNGSYTVRVTG